MLSEYALPRVNSFRLTEFLKIYLYLKKNLLSIPSKTMKKKIYFRIATPQFSENLSVTLISNFYMKAKI